MAAGRFAAVTAAFRDLARACVALETAFADLDAEPEPRRLRAPAPVREPDAPKLKQKPVPVAAPDGITASSARVLAALHDAGQPLDRRSVAIRSGLAYKSSTLDRALADLRSEGLIAYEGTSNVISESGRALALKGLPELPQGAGLFEYWLEKVGSSAAPGKVLRAMRTAHKNGQHALSRAEISEASGLEYKSSTLDRALAKLRALELLQGGGSDNRLVSELVRACEVTIAVYDRQSGKSVRVTREGTVAR